MQKSDGRIKVICMFTSIHLKSRYGVILLREDQIYYDVHRVPSLLGRPIMKKFRPIIFITRLEPATYCNTLICR